MLFAAAYQPLFALSWTSARPSNIPI